MPGQAAKVPELMGGEIVPIVRWLFAETNEEMKRRALLLEQIDAWWSAFVDKADEIDQHFTVGAELDLTGWIAGSLQRIDARLMWEFGPATDREGHRLVITPEFEYRLRPLVDTIMERAPELKMIGPHWVHLQTAAEGGSRLSSHTGHVRWQGDAAGLLRSRSLEHFLVVVIL